MNRTIKYSIMALAAALLLTATPRAQQRHTSDNEPLSPGEQAYNNSATTPQTKWLEVQDVDLDLESTCKQQQVAKPKFVNLASDKEFLQVYCSLKEERRREPKDRPEANGWNCELVKPAKKVVKITYWCNKHHECQGTDSEEPKSYLKVKITVKVEIKE